MTTKTSSPTVLSRHIAKSKMARLAAIILAGAVPLLASAQQQSIFMANPSFEVGYVNQSYPGYQASIPGWLVTVNTIGINNSTGPFWDNSGPVDGSFVYFQQGDGFLEQTNSGFQVGQTYWLQFFVNARHQQSDTPNIYIFEYASTIGSASHLLEQPISQSSLGPYGTAGNGVPFTFVNVPFVAAATNGVLYMDKLSASGSDTGNASVLYDGFSIIQRSASDVVIANPSFEASGTNQTAPGYMTAIAGWETQGVGSLAINQQASTFSDNGTIPDGVNVLCLTSGEGVSQELHDLAVGETYQLSIYLNATAATASPTAVIQIGGNTAFTGPVTAVGGANSYAYKSYYFTASTTSALLTISNATPTATASTLLVDNVRVLGFPGSITVANPSFEQNGAALAPAYPGYCTIPGWTFTGDNGTQVGVNPGNWSGAEAFWDNGGPVDQSYVGFAQSDGILSQPLNGFLVGQTYWIQVFANSRSTYTQNDTPVISVYEGASTAGPLAVASGMTITPAGTYPTSDSGVPFTFINVPFVAAATNGTLGFAKISASGKDTGGASWLFDGVSVIQRSPNDVVIANPSFEASGNTSLQTPGDYQGYVSSIAGWTTTNIGGGGGALIVGQLGGPYVDNGTVPDGANVLGLKGLIGVSQVLQGLVPGNSYTLSLYLNERAWDPIWGGYVTAQVTIDGQTAFNGTVSPAGTSGTFNPYQFVSYNFVADNTNVTLTIANINPDSVQGTLLVDNVRVVATAPTVVELSAIYNGSNIMGSGSLTIANNANGTNLTLLGTAVLAGKSAGSEAITSPPQGTTPALVQTATGNSGSSASTTIPVTLTKTPVNGDTMIAVISTRGTALDEVTSISQTGATWTQAVASAADTHGTTTEIWYATNVSGAGTSVTITQASFLSAAVVMEYSGLLNYNPVDVTTSTTGTTSTTNSATGTTATTAQGGELWIGGLGLQNSTNVLAYLPLKSFSTVASAASTSSTVANNALVYALARYATTATTANSGAITITNGYSSGAIATFKQGGLTLSGIAAGSYTLSGVTSVTVTPKPLTVSGLTVPSSKVYDGTTTAVVSGSPGTLATAEAVGAGTTSDGKPYTGDTVSTTGIATGTYNDPSVALASTVTYGGVTLTGAQASDYSVKAGTAAATIKPRALTLSGSMPYNGSALAASGNLSIANNVDGANLTLSGTVALSGKGAGSENVIYYATPTLVQSATGNAGSSATTSFTVPLGIAPVDGNTLIAVISTRGNASDEVISVTQNSGTVPWTRAIATAADTHNISTEIWYAPNVSGAGTTVTITTGTSLLSAAVVMEYSGLYTSSSLDQTKSNTGGSTTAATTGTSTATGQTAELWIGGIGFTNSSYTLGNILNGFTTVASAQSTSSISAGTNDNVYALARITNSTGTASSGGTISTASYWSGAVATFGAAIPGSLILGGSAAGNYTLVGLGGSVTVTAKALTMSGLSVPASKPYDGTTMAVVSGSPGSLQTAEAAGTGSTSDGAPYIGDAVSITGTATGTYNDPSVALASTVTYGGLSLTGAQSSYYSLTIQSPASATITLAAPTVTCPANISDTNLIGQCGNTESFAATTNNTGGAITLTYTTNGVTISSPWFFPVGTSTVTATVTNSSGTNSCTFTVTVNESPLPAPGPFSLYAVDGSTASMPIAKLLLVASSGSGGNTLSVAGVTPTTGTGATVGISGGMLNYTPLGNYVGTDTINYVLTDGCGTAPGTISVIVSASGAGNNLGYGAVVGGNLQLQFFGVVGTNYWLQVSSPTATGPWSDVPVGNSGGAVNANPVPANGSGMINYIVYPVLPSPAFYRTSTTP